LIDTSLMVSLTMLQNMINSLWKSGKMVID